MKSINLENYGDPVNMQMSVPLLRVRPILKWAGGKQQLLPQLLAKVPGHYNKYIEPFFGGGAFFFALRPRLSVIADVNAQLMEVYLTVAYHVEELIEELKTFKINKETYYRVRSQDTSQLSMIQRAARLIYLNKTCFNGLYRVNREGLFNVPYGDHKNPRIGHPDDLRAASVLLRSSTILAGDYKAVLSKHAAPGDFIYIDPPYLPVSQYSDFKRYTKEQFYEEDHLELRDEVLRLHELGCHVVLSNSHHPLVYDLYRPFKIEVYQTRRNISKDGGKRRGEDVIIYVPPARRVIIYALSASLSPQVQQYPTTRYMGSKQAILPSILEVASAFQFNSVLDLFSGSGIVGYMFKCHGKQVMSNDFMAMNAMVARALIENNQETLPEKEAQQLLEPAADNDGFVAKTFKDLYFSLEENVLIDDLRANIKKIKNKYQQAIAQSALIRAALKKRPRGIFTYTGERYNDNRKDLQTSFAEHFLLAVQAINGAVFDNGKKNLCRHGDAMTIKAKPDLVYFDPPYYSPLSDNDYVRRYHFLEGLACDWRGLTIQEHTKTKKFKSYPSPFSSRVGAHEAFDKLFASFKESILMVSYSSNSLPSKEELLSLLAKYKNHVEVISVDHRYSFANQGHKVNDNNNSVSEYIFVAY